MSDVAMVTIPLSDYQRLIKAAEVDDMLVWCETCGAWLDREDPATAFADDFTGCWKAATHDARFDNLCRSYRSPRDVTAARLKDTSNV